MTDETILYSSCYLEGDDALGNSRLTRTARYVNYYWPIRERLGFDVIRFCDNGSRPLSMNDLSSRIRIRSSAQVEVISFPNLEHHKRTPHHYPHCWRSLYYVRQMIEEGFKKIIMIDTDGFVLTDKLASYIRALDTGYTAFWCPRWQFPETALTVLCEDTFPHFLEFTKGDWNERVGSLMEWTVPFTHVEKKFVCDRFGETNAPIESFMDYYGQAGPNVIPKFRLI